jgi:hypothetical protein
MNAPDALVAELMQLVRSRLYDGKDRQWFPQQEMVKQAMTYPAHWLSKRQVPLSHARYKAIMVDVIETMARRGNLEKVTFISRYVLHCVQEHMKHHGDKYYAEGKSIRNRVSVVMTEVEKAKIGADSTVPVLAQVHDNQVAATLQVGRRKPKGTDSATPVHPDLFR